MFRNLWSRVSTPVRDALTAVWLGIIILIGLIFLMWVFNVIGWKGINIPITVLGTLVIGFAGFRSNLLLQVGLLGAIVSLLEDKDKSQGVTTGLLWLTRIIIVLAYAFVFTGFTLITWSFEENPAGFWVILIGISLILLVNEVYGRSNKWAPNVLTAYVIFVMIVNVWATFGSPYVGRSFNPHTGEPKVMVDPVTHKTDSLKRTPAECRPAGTNHDGFPYNDKGTCFSAETGKRLVPMAPESAMIRNPTSWIGAGWSKWGEVAGANQLLWIIPVAVLVALIVFLVRLFRTKATMAGATPASADRGVHPSTALLIAIVGAVAIVMALKWLEEEDRVLAGSCIHLEDVARGQLSVGDPGGFVLSLIRQYFSQYWMGNPPAPDYADLIGGETKCFSIGKDSPWVNLHHRADQVAVCRLSEYQPTVSPMFLKGLTVDHLVLVDNFAPGVSRLWPIAEPASVFYSQSPQARQGMDVNTARYEVECYQSPP